MGRKPVRVAHVEAGPVVAHEVDRQPVGGLDANLDAGVRLLARELPGVPEQVVQDHAQQSLIREDVQARGDDALHTAVWVRALELFKYQGRQSAQIDFCFAQVLT